MTYENKLNSIYHSSYVADCPGKKTDVLHMIKMFSILAYDLGISL